MDLEAAHHIAQIAPKTPLLMFTMHKSEQLVIAAQAAGIRDVISKTNGVSENIISAIQNSVGLGAARNKTLKTPA